MSRRAWWLIGLATLLSWPLRVWPLGRLGLNQFDEGIYAMAAGWASRPGGIAAIDPGLIPYAPPGFAILVGCGSLVIGSSDQAALLISSLLGTLTVPVVALIAHQVFGQRAAIVTAWSVCGSGPHIAFSRMGLTDATFLLSWSLGFLLCLRFLREPGFWPCLGMGLLVGLTQQIKYNGWLLGGLVIATFVVGLLTAREERVRGRWVRVAGWGGLAAVVAALVVFPWYQFVETHGGYAGLLSHQRGFLGGPAGWWPHLVAQANQAVMLAGPFRLALATGAAIMGSIRLLEPPVKISGDHPERRLVACSLLMIPLFCSPLLGGLLTIPWLGRYRGVALRFLVVSWVALLVLSPFYHPYARLWLPFEMLHWVLLGGLLTTILERAPLAAVPTPRVGKWLSRVGMLALVSLGYYGVGPGFPFTTPGPINRAGLFEPSDSLRTVAAAIQDRLPPEVTEVRTLIRPALTYYLAGRFPVFPQANLEQFGRFGQAGTWGLVDSTLLTSRLGIQDQMERDRIIRPMLDRWEVVAEFPAATTLPTMLDLDPTLRDYDRAGSTATVWLLRPRVTSELP